MTNGYRATWIVPLATVFGLTGTRPLASQTVHYEGSVSATTGRYIFSERTTSIAWSSGLAVTVGRVTIRAAVPVWWQNTPLVTASGMGQIPSGGGGERSRAVSDSAMARRRRGDGTGGGGQAGMMPALAADAAVPVDVTQQYETALGDPVASASMTFGTGRATVTLGVGAKVPVADTASFGTGEWDVGGSAALSVRVRDRTLVGVDASYWHLGDLAELDFRDPVTGGVSLSHLFGSRWGAMVSATAATAPIEGFPGPAAIGGGVTRFWGGSAVGLNLAVGLTQTSPDVSGGLTWRIGF